jgi:hypothetical protein
VTLAETKLSGRQSKRLEKIDITEKIGHPRCDADVWNMATGELDIRSLEAGSGFGFNIAGI